MINDDTISHVSLERLEEDSLVVSASPGLSDDRNLTWIAVESISELRQIKKAKFWKGAGIGLFSGTAVGAVIGATLSNTSGLFSDSGDGFDIDLSEMSK